jgi:heme exporter protein D
MMIDLDMSPYSAFVWPSWGLTVLVLGALVVRATLDARRRRRELSELEANKTEEPS